MIKSKPIIEYLVTVYGKNIEEINVNEIENLVVSNKDMDSEYCEFYPEDLKLFPNLKGIVFNTAVLSSEQMEKISELVNIENINFKDCAFENDSDLSKITNLKELSMKKCYVEDYSFLENMPNLQILEIIAPQSEEDIDLEKIKSMPNLNKIILDLCNIKNIDKLNGKNIEYLSLLMTEIPNNNVEFLNALPNLKKLYISEKYNYIIDRNDIEIKNDLIDQTFEKEL